MVAEELSPYLQKGEARAELIGPTLMLKPKSAQSIAIVLHELTTNAVKYGALSVSAGRVRVQWSDAADGRLVILWTEENGPPVKPPERRGFGTRVVNQLIQSELSGEAHFEWRAEGVVCRLAFDTAVEF
jgi:two-component sensor histidine kinase